MACKVSGPLTHMHCVEKCIASQYEVKPLQCQTNPRLFVPKTLVTRPKSKNHDPKTAAAN